MDKEIIELLKTVAGSTETLVLWYIVLDFAKHVVANGTIIVCTLFGAYFIGRGWRYLSDVDQGTTN